MVSADYSATHHSQSVLFAPPTPSPEFFFFFFCFPCPALSAEQGPGDLAGCGIQRGPDRKPFCCGVGGKRGRGSKGVSARTTEAEDEDRRRPALGGVPIARFCKS